MVLARGYHGRASIIQQRWYGWHMRRYATLLIAAFALSCLTFNSHGQDLEIARLPLQLIDDVKIATLDPGLVKNISVRIGDRVKQGDLLLELDSDIFEADVAAQEANYLVALADAESDVQIRFSEKSLALNQAILKKNEIAVVEFARSVSQTELGKLRLERDQAALGLERAVAEHEKADLVANVRAAELDTAKIRLGRRSIKSPCDGVVVKIEAQAGEAVGNGQVVFRVINLDKLRLIASVDREWAGSLSLDTKARFEFELKGEVGSVPARIVFLSPEIRYTEQTFDVWFEVDNSDRKLLPGLKGKLLVGESTKLSQPAQSLAIGTATGRKE